MAEAIISRQAQGTSSSAADRLLGLEAVRFVAAFAVLVWHYQHFADVAGIPVGLTISRLPLYGWLKPFYDAGRCGVWVFWCVSGFIFFWRYADAIAARSVSARLFFVGRLSRLYPLHFATLLAVALLQAIYWKQHGYYIVYQFNDMPHFGLQLLMASRWGLEAGDSFNGPIWSVSVEILVYAIFFVTLRFVTRSLMLNVVVIIGCLTLHGQFVACLGFFYIGGLAATARRQAVAAGHPAWAERLGWAAALMLPLGMWISGARQEDIGWPFVMAYTPIALFCLSRPVTLSARVERVLEAAGNMTYSIYLLHFPIQLLIATLCAAAGTGIPFYETWFFVVFVASTMLASRLTYLYFEAPARALLRRQLLREAVLVAPAFARTTWRGGSVSGNSGSRD